MIGSASVICVRSCLGIPLIRHTQNLWLKVEELKSGVRSCVSNMHTSFMPHKVTRTVEGTGL